MGLYYSPPPPPQRVVHFTAGTPALVSNPPRVTLASLMGLLAIWPSVYEFSPYRSAQQGQGNYAAQAPAPAVVNNPPFAPRVPLFSADAGQKPYYGNTYQYGFAYNSSATISGMAVNNPPFARRNPVIGKNPGNYYGEGQQYGFTYSSGALSVAPIPPVVSQPPGFSVAAPAALRATWPQDNWPAQRAFANQVQPYPGDEPPGYLMPPDLAAFPDITWGTQSTTRAVATLPPPPVVSSTIPPGIAALTALRAVWLPDDWNAQRVYSPIVTLTLTYGQQPPRMTLAPLYALRSAWPDAVWTAQSAPVSQIVGTKPVLANTAMGASIRSLWAPDAWNGQKAPSTPLTVTYGQRPIPTSRASLYAQRSTWSAATWTVQRAAPSAVLSLTPVNAPPAPNRFNAILRAAWLDTVWDTQRAAQVLQLPNRGAKPTPQNLAGFWPQPDWLTQHAPYAVTNVPPAVVNNPPPASNAALNLIVNAWLPAPPLPPVTSAFGKPYLATLATDPGFVIIVPYRAFTVTWLPGEWEK